jgi:serine/threonine-protein kinase
MRAPEEAAPGLTHSPTLLTAGAGVILGTAAYMSPEQARGQPVDKRSDVWAFGCVLYEMLTGKVAFARDTVSDTLAAVLGSDPDWTMVGPSVPVSLRLLVQRCLEKDRRRRVADISTAQFVMSEPAIVTSSHSLPAASEQPRGIRSSMVVAVIAVAALTGAVVAGAMSLVMGPSPRRVTRLTVTPSGTSTLSLGLAGGDMAISPDGTQIIYVGNKGTQLFARALDRLESVPITQPGGPPSGFCFSPDGRWIAFVDTYLLKKIAVTGGPAVTLGGFGGGNLLGITWSEKGTIVLATDANLTGLIQVSQDGGEPKVLTQPNRDRGEVDHLWPTFLPGGTVVLFTITSAGGLDNAQIAALNLQTGAVKVLVKGGTHARYVPSGHLVYGASGGVRAVPFDLNRLEVVGNSVAVLPQVLITSSGSVDADVASDGTLVYVIGGLPSSRALVWVDRQGHEEVLETPPRAYQYPRVSPDGTRVAIDVRDQDNDIWILELGRGALTRFTVDPALDRFPAWTRDGRYILFASDRVGHATIFRQAADGAGAPEQLTRESTVEQMPQSTTPDGAWLLFRNGVPQSFDLNLLALNGEHRIQPLVHSSFSEQNGEISPDGRWLAYQSNDAGRLNVYVRPFPDVDAGRWQVSPDGGTQPLWAPSGRELFYLGPTGLLQSVSVAGGSTWAAARPSKVLDEAYYVANGGEAVGRTYDISSDGARFLMIKAADGSGRSDTPSIVVVQNWFDELKRLAPNRP